MPESRWMYSGDKLKLNRKAQITIGIIIIITSGLLALTAGVKYATTGTLAPKAAVEQTGVGGAEGLAELDIESSVKYAGGFLQAPYIDCPLDQGGSYGCRPGSPGTATSFCDYRTESRCLIGAIMCFNESHCAEDYSCEGNTETEIGYCKNEDGEYQIDDETGFCVWDLTQEQEGPSNDLYLNCRKGKVKCPEGSLREEYCGVLGGDITFKCFGEANPCSDYSNFYGAGYCNLEPLGQRCSWNQGAQECQEKAGVSFECSDATNEFDCEGYVDESDAADTGCTWTSVRQQQWNVCSQLSTDECDTKPECSIISTWVEEGPEDLPFDNCNYGKVKCPANRLKSGQWVDRGDVDEFEACGGYRAYCPDGYGRTIPTRGGKTLIFEEDRELTDLEADLYCGSRKYLCRDITKGITGVPLKAGESWLYKNKEVAISSQSLMSNSDNPIGTMFLTSQKYDGDLRVAAQNEGCTNCDTGLDGANYLCGEATNDAGLKGIWIAMLSDSETDLKDRTPSGPYFNIKKELVYSEFTGGFCGGTYLFADSDAEWSCNDDPYRCVKDTNCDPKYVQYDENEVQRLDYNSRFWSGSDESGNVYLTYDEVEKTCNSWESSSSNYGGQLGGTGGASSSWGWETIGGTFSYYSTTCDGTARLMCTKISYDLEELSFSIASPECGNILIDCDTQVGTEGWYMSRYVRIIGGGKLDSGLRDYTLDDDYFKMCDTEYKCRYGPDIGEWRPNSEYINWQENSDSDYCRKNGYVCPSHSIRYDGEMRSTLNDCAPFGHICPANTQNRLTCAQYTTQASCTSSSRDYCTWKSGMYASEWDSDEDGYSDEVENDWLSNCDESCIGLGGGEFPSSIDDDDCIYPHDIGSYDVCLDGAIGDVCDEDDGIESICKEYEKSSTECPGLYEYYGVSSNLVLCEYSDNDNDGLIDWDEEDFLGTDIDDSDSDNDGFEDKEELDGGSDPNNGGSTPQSCVAMIENNYLSGAGLISVACSDVAWENWCEGSYPPYNTVCTWSNSQCIAKTGTTGVLSGECGECITGYVVNNARYRDNCVSVTLDSDKDGLEDYLEETVYYTDKNRWDDDYDGYSDGLEVDEGSDPTNGCYIPNDGWCELSDGSTQSCSTEYECTTYTKPSEYCPSNDEIFEGTGVEKVCLLKDSDGDGIADIDEENIGFDIDIDNEDTDGDGSDDREEMDSRTDPTDDEDTPRPAQGQQQGQGGW
jgi:hypothetical protein